MEGREREYRYEYGGGVNKEVGGGRKFYHISARCCTWVYSILRNRFHMDLDTDTHSGKHRCADT